MEEVALVPNLSRTAGNRSALQLITTPLPKVARFREGGQKESWTPLEIMPLESLQEIRSLLGQGLESTLLEGLEHSHLLHKTGDLRHVSVFGRAEVLQTFQPSSGNLGLTQEVEDLILMSYLQPLSTGDFGTVLADTAFMAPARKGILGLA